MAKIVDANVIIRYLVGGSSSQVKKIRELLSSSKEKLILTDVTLAEIVWVLGSYYEQSREEIADKILSLLDISLLIANKSMISRAIYYFREYNLDYIDAYLIAYSQENKISGILSFDRSIDRVKEVKRTEP